MASMFCDSFDPYNTLLLKWASGNATFNTDPTFIRTGNQSLVTTNGEGFNGLPRINFATRQTVVVGIAMYFTAIQVQLFGFFNSPEGQIYGQLIGQGDGSIRVESDGFIGQTPPGFLTAGKFYYIEMKATFTTPGDLEIRVNGATALKIVNGQVIPDGFSEGVDGFLLQGSAVNNVYCDDLYLLDGTGGVNDDFLGPVQVFAILPDANETPLNFTPLGGSNFSEVNQAPPPGDAAYVFAGTVGNEDQYHYTITGPAEAYQIAFIQHSLCAKLDAPGSHTIASRINATSNATPQIGTTAVGPNYQYALFVWDKNPNTSAQFQPTDFSTTFLGPIITT